MIGQGLQAPAQSSPCLTPPMVQCTWMTPLPGSPLPAMVFQMSFLPPLLRINSTLCGSGGVLLHGTSVHRSVLCNSESGHKYRKGLTCSVRHWFSFYLHNGYQFVHMGTSKSQKIPITYGDHLLSIWSPVIFSLWHGARWDSTLTKASKFTNTSMMHNSS